MAYGGGWKKRKNLNRGITFPGTNTFGGIDVDGPPSLFDQSDDPILSTNPSIDDPMDFGPGLYPEEEEDEGRWTDDLGKMLLRYAYSRMNPFSDLG